MSKKGSPDRWYVEEPRGQTYGLLLTALSGRGNDVTLALSRSKASPLEIPAPLRNHVRAVRPVANRFGNAGTVEVAYLSLSKACARALQTCAQAWFDWQLPGLPEDLAIQSGDQILVGSVTHEHECWLEGEREFITALLQDVPTLKVLEGPGFRGGR
jgi:hypothetical protein